MTSKWEIQMNFEAAIHQAESLEQVASRMKRVARQEMGGTLQELSYIWKGDNANAYRYKGERVQTQIQNTAEELEMIAGDIRRIAKRIYNAEMQALLIAESRNY